MSNQWSADERNILERFERDELKSCSPRPFTRARRR